MQCGQQQRLLMPLKKVQGQLPDAATAQMIDVTSDAGTKVYYITNCRYSRRGSRELGSERYASANIHLLQTLV